MNTENAFFGMPIEIDGVCLIYPPTIKDIVQISYEVFNIYSSFLTKSQDELDDSMKEEKLEDIPTPFVFLLTLMLLSPEMEKMIKNAFKFFLKEEVLPLYDLQMIVIGKPMDKRCLTADNFFDFQNGIRASIGLSLLEKPNPNEHPKVRRFKALQRERDRIKAKNNKTTITKLTTLITSICCMNMGVTPMNVQDMTMAAINMLIERYNEKDSFETRVAAMLAGASEDKDKLNWIRDL